MCKHYLFQTLFSDSSAPTRSAYNYLSLGIIATFSLKKYSDMGNPPFYTIYYKTAHRLERGGKRVSIFHLFSFQSEHTRSTQTHTLVKITVANKCKLVHLCFECACVCVHTSLMIPTAPWILATWPRRVRHCCPTILRAGRKLTREEGLACDTSTSAPSRASVSDWSSR